MADIPGLIEGAHEGIGLGDDFLRHIERTRVIVHLIDLYPMEGQPRPAEAYRIIRNELQKYSQKLADKPELVVANKLDLSDSDAALEALRDELGTGVLGISGVAGRGLEPLMERVWALLEEIGHDEEPPTAAELTEDPFAPRPPDAAPEDQPQFIPEESDES
jgi:GTP-binding protein